MWNESHAAVAGRTELSEELSHAAAANRERVVDGGLDHLPVAGT